MIETGGFRTNVIPQYTPVDPNLVGFNPGAFTDGVSKSLEIREAMRQLKEAQATQALRIAAMNAKNQQTVDVNPSSTSAAVSGNVLSTVQNAADVGNVNAIAAAKKAAALQATGESGIAIAGQEPRLKNAATIAAAEGETRLNELKAKDVDFNQKVALASSSEAAAKATLDETINNLAEDKSTHRDLVKAQTDYYKAHADAQEAIASYNNYQRGAGKPYADHKLLGDQISQETQNLARLYGEKVSKDENGKDQTLGQFLDQFESYQKNKKGEPIKATHLFKADEIATLPSNVKALMSEVEQSQNNIKKLRQLQGQLQFSPVGAKGAATASQPKSGEFSTPAEAQAAVEAGQFQDGDTIIIGGKPKIVRIKK